MDSDDKYELEQNRPDRDLSPLESSLTDKQELLISLVSIGLLAGFAMGFVSIHLVVLLGALNILRIEAPKAARVGLVEYLYEYNFKRPTLTHLGVLFVGLVGYYFLMVVLGNAMSYTSVQLANHAISEGFNGGSIPMYYLIAYVLGFFFLFAPMEEMMFRHYLTKDIPGSKTQKIIIANIVFSIFHTPVYLVTGPTLLGFVVVLFILFLMGCFFSVLYEATDNLTIPTLAHGAVNSIAIGALFFL